MTTTINASPTNGIVQTADGSGVMKLQSNGVTTNALAWVNYNGSTTAILASYNVSSVTRNGAGDYTINFTTAMADANYCPCAGPGRAATSSGYMYIPLDTNTSGVLLGKTTTAYRVTYQNVVGAVNADVYMNIAIFGN